MLDDSLTVTGTTLGGGSSLLTRPIAMSLADFPAVRADSVVIWAGDASSSGIGVRFLQEAWFVAVDDLPPIDGWSAQEVHRSSDAIFVWELLGTLLPILLCPWGQISDSSIGVVDPPFDKLQRGEGGGGLLALLQNRLLISWTDNAAVTRAVSNGRCSNRPGNVLLRIAGLKLRALGSHLVSLWCSRDDNEDADSLSKLLAPLRY